MSEPSHFVLPEAVAEEMSQVIAQGVTTFLSEFTSKLFPDCQELMTQECIAAGVASGVLAFQQRTGVLVALELAKRLAERDMPDPQASNLQ